MFEVAERASILRLMLRFMLLDTVLSFGAMFVAALLMPLESFGKGPHGHFGGAFVALLVAFGFGRSISRSSQRLAEMNCWAWLVPGSILTLLMLQEWLQPPPISSVPSELFYSSSDNEGGYWHLPCHVPWRCVGRIFTRIPVGASFKVNSGPSDS